YFLASQSEPRECKIGDIEPTNQQNEKCATPEKIKSPFYAAYEHILQRLHGSPEPRVDQQLFHFREALEIFIIQGVYLSLRLPQRCARRQAADVVPVVAVMNGLLFGSNGERNPQANFRV